jgi:hypothetical protein
MDIKAIYRQKPGHYVLENDLGRKINIQIHDDDILHLARSLGFDQWYDLEDHLEVLSETWVGCLLVRGGDSKLPQ